MVNDEFQGVHGGIHQIHAGGVPEGWTGTDGVDQLPPVCLGQLILGLLQAAA